MEAGGDEKLLIFFTWHNVYFFKDFLTKHYLNIMQKHAKLTLQSRVLQRLS